MFCKCKTAFLLFQNINELYTQKHGLDKLFKILLYNKTMVGKSSKGKFFWGAKMFLYFLILFSLFIPL